MSIEQGESLGARLTGCGVKKNYNCEMCKRGRKPFVHVKRDLSQRKDRKILRNRSCY